MKMIVKPIKVHHHKVLDNQDIVLSTYCRFSSNFKKSITEIWHQWNLFSVAMDCSFHYETNFKIMLGDADY